MDKFDYDTKALVRAERVIRTVLENDVNTDISTVLPLLGFANTADALDAADRFGAEAGRITSPARRQAVQDAKKALAGLPDTVLRAFDRKVGNARAE